MGCGGGEGCHWVRQGAAGLAVRAQQAMARFRHLLVGRAQQSGQRSVPTACCCHSDGVALCPQHMPAIHLEG